MTKRIAIVGVRGYTGTALAKCIARHPSLEFAGIFGSRDGDLGDVPSLAHLRLPVTEATPESILDHHPDAVMLCTPVETSLDLVPGLVGRVPVVDLSAAYRLKDASLFERVYGVSHHDATVLEHACYGMPEVNRDEIVSASLIASPGCYPTSAILALHPVRDVVSGIVIHSISGVSGAGRQAKLNTSFCEVSLEAYGVQGHRHEPEIAQALAMPVHFVPHLAPVDRGILTTIHATTDATEDEIRARLHDAYADEAFVSVLEPGRYPRTSDVKGTNRIHIGVHVRNGALVLVSAIDNLLKGAAGQAMQSLNILLDLPEGAGIPEVAP
ncbi:MAG: N-acetyl-gamma-glutamyl-phosphate reductase [Phycisphaerales bacterium]|nr:N-acetyl-gamma-glutamyl-phosphate reductase [Phycisphaerales bacterium]